MKFDELTPLAKALARLEAKNIDLGRARNVYLMLECERKHFEAKLVGEALGKSHAERMIHAQGSEEWLVFHKKLARAESEYEFIKLQFSILEKTWQSLYLETKLDGSVILKQE